MTDRYDWVFKTYDIRSLDHDPMDETFCYSFGRGVANYMKQQWRWHQAVMLSCDGRPSNTDFMIAFVAWLQDGWHEHFELCNRFAESIEWQEHPFGVCCSSFFYYCAAKLFNISIQFTASHNPPERVGCKGCDITASLYPTYEFKSMIKEYIDYPYGWTDRHQSIKQSIIQKVDAWSVWLQQKQQDYLDLLTQAFSLVTKPATIVVDYSGWAAASWEKYFLETALSQSDAPVTILSVNERIDGTFACHLSDTSIPANYTQVGDLVKRHQADFGVMFDGDWDRIGMVDEQWAYIQGWNLVALIARGVLKAQWNGPIVWDITCTNAVQEWVEQEWWTYHMSRVWYRFVKQVMKENNALFGWELSCHFLFPETHYSEGPLLALAYVLKTLESYPTMSHEIQSINHYVTPPLRNYTVVDKEATIQAFKQHYKAYPINELDGVKVLGDDRRVLLRKSGTEPIIRFYCEAKSEEKVKQLTREVEAIIASL